MSNVTDPFDYHMSPFPNGGDVAVNDLLSVLLVTALLILAVAALLIVLWIWLRLPKMEKAEKEKPQEKKNKEADPFEL